MRSLGELRDVDDPAWPALAAAIAAAPGALVLLVEPPAGEVCLLALQVTARSTLGALALHAGAVLIDHGWLRLLGAGTSDLPSLAAARGIVAHDVLGGRFGFGAGGEIRYWGPDTLAWTPLGLGHSAFVAWALGDGVADFYADLRWPGWAEEVAAVGLDQGLSVYPPLCAAESRPTSGTSRRPIPWTELCAFLDELAAVAGPPGAPGGGESG